ncbi:aminopeptidase N [Brevirhabdus sp.]|uniref:aminopeptidase N n=1 Tax=Brevirhabdus sp. TaxID=2004514 RepID=UPI004058D1F6
MALDQSGTIYLADYTPFGFLIDGVDLTFRLSPSATRVLARISFRPNPAASSREFFLHGEALELISARIDGQPVHPTLTAEGLRVDVPDAPFVWESEVQIDPAGNTALEGLYMSNGMYCTQCEAEGFRKITYYPDRPDVMATFKVRIEGTAQDTPVMLSNGNPTAQGDGWAEWDDPWPKPAYLFALVAGDLRAVSDSFTTRSGREVALNVWVRPGDEGKCDFALDALKRAMKWDEDTYGREYDLDLFNIVAVDDFNMGAMENKGLNIFNSSAVLASPDTATDANYERIEAIIAHEYFHNWTGNRITCRDWFQLCLKEGLTVFRDQQFTGDMRSPSVKRIDDVLTLRGRQFREDNGPLAHPVRPDRYVEINNFYTATVYEKGAQVIGMLKRLVGDAAYYKALNLYFTRHDGQACTIEDWLKVFEDTTGRDLSQFRRWYTDAGTPRLAVRETFEGGRLTLSLRQETPATPNQPDKPPRVIPVAVGLLSSDGNEVLPTTLLEMTEREQSFHFDGLAERPVTSLLRDFSAPVIVQRDRDAGELAFLLAHDTDPFNRWEAGRALAKSVLMRMVTNDNPPMAEYLDALEKVAADDTLDPAFVALAMRQPGDDDIAQSLFDAGVAPDPIAIHAASERLSQALAQGMATLLPQIYQRTTVFGPYSPRARDAGNRALQQAALWLITRLDKGKLAARQFQQADNMTLQLGALSCLLSVGRGEAQVAAFYKQWHHDRLVLDKWFALQVSHALPDRAADLAAALSRHRDFEMRNPNRFRSVFGALAMNAAGFHDPSGASYRLMADHLIKLDALNPQAAARMSTAFETWRRYDADRQQLMQQALRRIAEAPGLSRDTGEMTRRLLEG